MGILINVWTMLKWTALRVPEALAVELGEDPPQEGIHIENPLSCEDWAACVGSLLNGLVIAAAPVTAIAVLVGGYQLMSSGGNEEKVSRGKKTILYAAAGYGVILLSTAVVGLVQGILGP